MKNIGIKILAAIITLILYLVVNSQTNRTEITLTLPVEFKNLPATKVILLPEERQVQVTLQGPSHQVSSLATSSLSFQVVLPDEVSNQQRVNLTSSNLKLSGSVEAYNINPATLDLFLDEVVEKTVKVEVPTIGKLNDNFKLVGIHTEPAELKASGPSTELSKISSVLTEPFDLRTIESSGESVFGLRMQNPYLKVEPEEVTVFYDVASIAQEKKFTGIKIEIRSNTAAAYKIEPAIVDIEISGPKNTIKRTKPKDLVPYLKIEQIVNSPKDVKVELDLPDGVTLINMEPTDVLITPVAIPTGDMQ